MTVAIKGKNFRAGRHRLAEHTESIPRMFNSLRSLCAMHNMVTMVAASNKISIMGENCFALPNQDRGSFMIVSSTASSQTFTGNGTTIAFQCDFRIMRQTDITVSYINPITGASALLVLNNDYTITSIDVMTGFMVTTATFVPIGMNLFVNRATSYTQPTNPINHDASLLNQPQNTTDQLEMQIRQGAKQIGPNISAPTDPVLVPNAQPSPPAARSLGHKTINFESGSVDVGVGSITDADIAANAGIQSSKLSFLRAGSGAVDRTVQSKLSERVSAKDFGATGNGIANDTAALQAAINYCVTSGCVLHIPVGTYLISASLTNTLQSGSLVIIGEGRNQTTILVNGSTAFATLSLGSNIYTANELLIENIGFVNKQTITGYGWTAINVQNVGHAMIDRIYSSGGTRAVYMSAGYACSVANSLIEGCYAEGIFLDNAAGNSSRIVGNGLFGCGIGGAAGAITLSSAQNALVASNDIEGGNGGIFMAGAQGGTIMANYIEGQSSYAIYFSSSSTGISILGNWLGQGGETIENCSNVFFKNNTFYNHHLIINSANAIDIDMCHNTILGSSSIPKNIYITPSFSNNWIADTTGFGGYLMTPGYRKDSNNFVHIRGAIKNGNAPLAFTLPAGYRPKSNLVFACSGYGLASPGAVQVTVELNGRVSIQPSNANTSLDGIVFEAEV